MITKKFITFLAAVFFAMALPASAYTLSQTQYFTGIPAIGGSLTFNQFDPNGGLFILQSIEISFVLQSSGGYIKIDNDSPLPNVFSFEFGVKGILSSTDVSLLNYLSQPIPGQIEAYRSQTLNLAANIGDGINDYDTTPPDGYFYNGDTIIDFNSGYVGNAYWTTGNKGFLGTGTYNINYFVSRHSVYEDLYGGVEFMSSPANAAGMVTVLYTYDIIPEPSTIALLACGTFAILNKKKNHKKFRSS